MPNQACKLIFGFVKHSTYRVFIFQVAPLPLKQTRHLRIVFWFLVFKACSLSSVQMTAFEQNSTPTTWVPPSHTFITPGQIALLMLLLLLQSSLSRSYVLHTSSVVVYDLRWQSGTPSMAEDRNKQTCKTDDVPFWGICQSCSRSWRLLRSVIVRIEW